MTQRISQQVKVDWCEPWLEGKGSNVYSQFGEDGLIAAALERFGEESRWCFECGAGDGITYSNVKRLIDDGWDALLVEQDAALYALLEANCPTAHSVHLEATGTSISILLIGHDVTSIDLGVIDIDGQDYWMWQLLTWSPRLMLVEFCRHNAEFRPESGREGQAGLVPILELGRSKGYRMIAHTHVNVLFVRNDVYASRSA